MTKSRKIWIFIIVIILVFVTIREYLYFIDTVNQAKKNEYLNNKTVLQSVLQLQKEKIVTTAQLITELNFVKEAFIEDDPEIIIENLTSYWEKIKDKNLVYEIHFFKPPATSFANMSNFNSNGDDISDVRSDIVYVTQSMNSSAHVMMCKTYAGIRGAYPIVDNGKVLGGLSFGRKLDWLPQTLKTLSNNESFLVYLEKATVSLVPSYKIFFKKDKKSYGEYLIGNETIKIDKTTFEKIDFSKNIQDIIIDNKRFSLNLFEFKDFENKLMGYSALLYNLEPLYNEIKLRILRDALILLIVGLLIYLILSKKLHSMEKELDNLSVLSRQISENKFDIIEDKKNELLKTSVIYQNLLEDILVLGDGFKKQLEQKDQILIQQSRLSTLGEMLDNIAHQWRQPLSLISTSASTIQLNKEMGILDEEENKKLDYIVQTSTSLSKTIDDFRSFLNAEKVVEFFTIEEAVDRTKILTEVSLEKYHIKVLLETHGEKVYGIMNELTQVLINLINNAQDVLQNLEHDKYIKIETSEDEKNIYIHVSDNAGGIPQNILNKLFMEKITTKENGLGLALFLSKNLLQNSFKGNLIAQNDQFIVNDKSYYGAKFTIILPK